MKLPRKAEIARVVEAARAAGLVVGSVSVAPDGTIHVSSARHDAPALSDYERAKQLDRGG